MTSNEFSDMVYTILSAINRVTAVNPDGWKTDPSRKLNKLVVKEAVRRGILDCVENIKSSLDLLVDEQRQKNHAAGTTVSPEEKQRRIFQVKEDFFANSRLIGFPQFITLFDAIKAKHNTLKFGERVEGQYSGAQAIPNWQQ